MRVVRVSAIPGEKNFAEFEMAPEEQILLWHLLRQYPLVPAGHQPLSQHDKNQDENEQLLAEALAEQRTANRRQIAALLNEPGRFAAMPGAEDLRVIFTFAEIEWLLQICNDIRVGSWLALGSPDLDRRPNPNPKPDVARHYFNMEIAGAFEMQVIRAVSGGFAAGDIG